MVRSNWISPTPIPPIAGSIDGWNVGINEVEKADYIYVMPREFFCSADRIRALEARHPLLYRESRGGGLIFEILGPTRRP
jgi:GH18 family chitinase